MVDTTLSLPAKIEPPFSDPPRDQTGVFTQPWNSWFTRISDRVASMWQQLLTIRTGVVDSSNAAPGDVGEYLFGATSAAVTLTNGATVNLASIDLTPGDWDVTGVASFLTPSGGTPFFFGVGIGGLDTIITAAFQIGPSNQILSTALSRHNVTTPTTVWVVGQCNFTGTATAATASIRARRVR